MSLLVVLEYEVPVLTKLVNVGFEFDEQAIIGELCVLAFGEFLSGAPLFE